MEKSDANFCSIDAYFEDQVILKEIDAGIEVVLAGRVKIIDPDNLWESR